MTHNDMTATPAATLTAKEFFLDRLESYFDFHEKSPKIAAKVLPDLLRECRAVLGDSESVEQDHHRIMISKVVGDEFLAKEWGREGYPLNGAAALLINRFQPLAEILSQSELFQRYLDAPVRTAATISTLIADPGVKTNATPRLVFAWESSGYFVPSFYEELLDNIESNEVPLDELERVTEELSNLLKSLKAMERDFALLADATRTEEPKGDAPDEVYRKWEENPRYLLPVIAENQAA